MVSPSRAVGVGLGPWQDSPNLNTTGALTIVKTVDFSLLNSRPVVNARRITAATDLSQFVRCANQSMIQRPLLLLVPVSVLSLRSTVLPRRRGIPGPSHHATSHQLIREP
jgi:hypothetical protein